MINSRFADPEDAEVLSSTSDPEEPETEDNELAAAAQQLTQDFLCQVIQEEEGRGKKTDDGEQEAGSEKQGVHSLRKAAPLAAILGSLPSAASLSLQRSPEDTSEKPEGESRTSIRDSDLVLKLTIYCRFWPLHR